MTRTAAAAALAVALLVAGCGGGSGSAPAAEAAAVTITGFTYQPDPLTVPAGAAVTWLNEDFFGHTVTGGRPGEPDGRFDGVLGEVADAAGSTFSFTFDQPGTYAYFCRFHPSMVATVHVTA